MTNFLKKALNYGIRNGLNIPELALAFSTGTRCTHSEYLELCTYFKSQENCDRYYTSLELN